ncbi:glutathione S-transferase-like [Andrographis paniculata]|uniref:glutathione S-transferase-like n=1 Tax=Andrographis paniculata TaxID=175694 RepID=UPI0021E78299|nr:glutathione S-transferase-like [Andrographis paniculata]
MGIKVHGHPFSIAAQRVLLCLAEKGLEYESVHIDLTTGQQKEEPFISLNPFGQVPGFEDGDLKLFESRAITHYIAHAYADKGTPLIDHDVKKMAIIGVWIEVESQKFEAAGSKLNFEIVVKPLKGMTPDEDVAEQLKGQLGKVLDVYEARLAESKYLGGDNYSLADLHHIPVINSLLKTKYKTVFEERPHVSAWVANILGRPATQKVLGGPKA